MTLKPGTLLGPYQIVSAIGAGGMGEVYKAQDTRLNRDVAIKVLPASFSARADLKQRFEREAQAIATLNHAHICVLYDVGQHDGIDFLVMEYLEGETLAARIARGPVPLKEAMTYALQIADALDKAHRRGVTHRDLKPGNIMITPSGAKLLDFGLAKLRAKEATGAPVSVSALPTDPQNLTADGAIVGTLQYMAPEQLEGKDADGRTDIFALGAVIYEMITGQKAFQGKSQVSLMAAILEHDPPSMVSLQPITPAALDRVVKICLEKDPEDRWQTARELLRELKWAMESSATHPTPVSGGASSWHRRLVWILAGISLIAALAVAGVWIRMKPQEVLPVRFGVPPPPDAVFGPENATAAPFQAISPDGKRIVFIARAKDSLTDTLWIRSLDSMEAQPLRGTEGANQFPFWSPDSRFIGFFAGGKLKKIDIAGGPPQILCDTAANEGGTWNRDGIILLGNPSGGLVRVSAAGGQPTAVTTLDASRKESAHHLPSFLPDGRHFLFTIIAAGAPSGAYVGSLDSNEKKELVPGSAKALYTVPGYILYAKESTLMAQPFDAARLELTGDAFPIAENVRTFVSLGRSAFSVSDAGILTYRTGEAANFELLWLDRTGKRLGSVGQPQDYRGIALSPDGKRIAVHRHESVGGDIWLIESLREAATTRFTFNAAQHYSSPVWSPDGVQIAFLGLGDIHYKVSSGAGNDELLVKSQMAKFPTAWSRDGRFIIYHSNDPKTKGDLWVVPTTGDRKPLPFLNTEFNETFADFSPDSRWVAYTSDESGKPEVYVQSFPASAGKWKISSNGGAFPRWRKDGREIFFLSADRKLWSVDVKAGTSSFDVGIPRLLFETQIRSVASGPNTYVPYDVSANGQRFLITTAPDAVSSEPITVVLNWYAGLRPPRP